MTALEYGTVTFDGALVTGNVESPVEGAFIAYAIPRRLSDADDKSLFPVPVELPVTAGIVNAPLLATTIDGIEPTGWTWKIVPQLTQDDRAIVWPAFAIEVPAGGTVDLSNAAPIESSAGAAPIGRGPRGLKGDKGDQGDKGDVGPAGLNWRGAWDPLVDYVEDDAVGYAGSAWFAVTNPAVGDEPGVASTWQAMAVKGSQGDKGDKGDQGDIGLTGPAPTIAAPINVSAGPAAASWSGSNPYTLNLTVPAGNVLSGNGAPNGVVTAPPGTLYVDVTKVLGASVWRKDSGVGNTGWVVVSGDTGWMTVRSWTASGFVTGSAFTSVWGPTAGVAGDIRVRRVNQTVFFRAYGFGVTGALPPGEPLYALPVGLQATSVFDATFSVPWYSSAHAYKPFYMGALTSRMANITTAAGDYATGCAGVWTANPAQPWITSSPAI